MSGAEDRLTPLAVDRTSATDAAAHRLRELILAGQLAPGAPLRQVELARQLGLSRTPLREALQRLRTEGLVQIDTHRGATVVRPNLAQVTEIYELQATLEATAGRTAALSSARQAALPAVRENLRRLKSSASPVAWTESNIAFHTSIYRIADRPLLGELIGLLRNRAALYVNLLARSRPGRQRADREHHQMVRALSDGDADRLETLIRQHLGGTLEWLRTVIRE